jgi:toxoflavin synthase
MCQNIFANLKAGGRFVTINNNDSQPPSSYLTTQKYGFIKSIDSPLIEGIPIKYTISAIDQKFSFLNYYLSKATYEWALRSVGFKEVRWQKPIVSPQGVEELEVLVC